MAVKMLIPRFFVVHTTKDKIKGIAWWTVLRSSSLQSRTQPWIKQGKTIYIFKVVYHVWWYTGYEA